MTLLGQNWLGNQQEFGANFAKSPLIKSNTLPIKIAIKKDSQRKQITEHTITTTEKIISNKGKKLLISILSLPNKIEKTEIGLPQKNKSR